MPRDYKSRSRRNEPESEGPSAVVWLFVGILVGLIISGVFYIKGQHNAATAAPTEKQTTLKHKVVKTPVVDEALPQKQEQPASTQNLQTQFDFYNVLPNKTQATQTQTTQPQKTVEASAPASSSTPNSNSNSNYVVQIATLSKPNDADQLKAQLLLLGFDVNVTPVQKNGQTLQRVWLGPFTNKSDATATQKQLKQNQITSNLLKLTT
jgi:cell division protein FtsN